MSNNTIDTEKTAAPEPGAPQATSLFAFPS